MYQHLHPDLTAALARQRMADLRAEADRYQRHRNGTLTTPRQSRLGRLFRRTR